MKKVIITSIFLLMLLAIQVSAESVNIGVSPPRIYAEHLLRGSHFEKQIVLSKTITNEDLTINIDIEGETSDWISVNKPKTFIFPKDAKSVPLIFTIDVPHNAEYGYYNVKANIRIKSKNTGPGLTPEAVFPISIKINVSDKEIIDYSVDNIKIPDTEKGSQIKLLFPVNNKGNTPARPSKINIEVLDKFKTETIQITEHEDFEYTPPFTKKEIRLEVPNNLPSEQYWARIKVYNNKNILKEEEVFFSILKNGKLGDTKNHLSTYTYPVLAVILLLAVFIFYKKRGG